MTAVSSTLKLCLSREAQVDSLQMVEVGCRGAWQQHVERQRQSGAGSSAPGWTNERRPSRRLPQHRRTGTLKQRLHCVTPQLACSTVMTLIIKGHIVSGRREH